MLDRPSPPSARVLGVGHLADFSPSFPSLSFGFLISPLLILILKRPLSSLFSRILAFFLFNEFINLRVFLLCHFFPRFFFFFCVIICFLQIPFPPLFLLPSISCLAVCPSSQRRAGGPEAPGVPGVCPRADYSAAVGGGGHSCTETLSPGPVIASTGLCLPGLNLAPQGLGRGGDRSGRWPERPSLPCAVLFNAHEDLASPHL